MRSAATLLLVLLILTTGCGPRKPAAVVEAEERLPERVDFNLHIKPILSDRCFACHGPDQNARKADLRLDMPDGAFVKLPETGNRAITRGSLRRSALAHRILSNDPGVMMPPPESNLSLSPLDKAMLLRWIEQGAEYKPHWSLIPPERPELPEVTETAWPRNEIDRFILARLERDDLTPSPEAGKKTLIRRVTFDLTGLPPTLEVIDAFLADDSPDAFEKVVDRLLASTAYGERMASEWLDVARYADSHGYQDDGLRNMWPWRDWVIRAFNQNLPYDDFVTWQLAGDLLPGATREQILATGFGRNHLQSQEGGIVPEEYRVDYVADRTETFGKAFLGMTVNCARCHDHKYDPISQPEYYQLFAFFNTVNEFGNIPYAGEASPTLILTDEEADRQLAALNEQIKDLEAEVDPANSTYDEGFQAWLGRLQKSHVDATIELAGLVGDYPLDTFKNDDYHFENLKNTAAYGYFRGDLDKLPEQVPGRFGTALKLRGDGWLDMGPDRYFFERNEPFAVSLWFNIVADSIAGPLFSKSGGLMNGKRGYMVELNSDGTLSASLNHVFPDNGLEIHTLDAVPVRTWNHLVLTYDGSSRAAGLTLYLDGEPMRAEVRNDNLRQSILYTVDPRTEQRTNWGDPGSLRIGFIGGNMTRLDSVAVDAFKVFGRRLTSLEVAALHGTPDTLATLLQTAPERWSEAQHNAARDYYLTRFDTAYRQAFEKLTALRGEANRILTAQPSIMVLREQPAKPRATHLLDRGAYDAPAVRVEPGTPESVGAFPDDLPKNRLGLARWLTDAQNPLFARVAVNRYWQMLFGQGFVSTPEDFGNQGALPTHPLLLDWLAIDFRENGWDVKRLLKQMVLSATYRQASVAPPALRERDPANELLARGPSRRLTAEMLRDQALAASGLLVPEVGGPPVKPYQPEGLWEELATRNATTYEQDQGDKLYRRSLYTIWKRTTPPPSMISFDASERNLCTVRRQSTSTPLQALILMNDPQFIEAARLLAERMLREGGPALSDRITFAFRLLTSRRPTTSELTLLEGLYADEHAAFETSPTLATDLLTVGEYPRDPTLAAADIAALTVVANTIMNHDAAVFKR